MVLALVRERVEEGAQIQREERGPELVQEQEGEWAFPEAWQFEPRTSWT
jgi:hypothetical protein